MAQNKMLIDATHPEETRVVVVRGNKVEEFDFESQNKQPLKGNIYLAKITRVEPSLQAAFVEYGGNKQGFLAFSEIHPDYYQIPVADREALIAEELEAAMREEEEGDEEKPRGGRDGGKRFKSRRKRGKGDWAQKSVTSEAVSEEVPLEEGATAVEGEVIEDKVDDNEAFLPQDHVLEQAVASDVPSATDEEEGDEEEPREEDQVEQLGESDAVEDSSRSRMTPLRRKYKIQEVIRRRQVVLIQVVKEERGNKGAAVTTYLSLAGRYAVLMPNTARGGGISRKITQGADRKRLKEVVSELDVPQGMGVILRTAGAARTGQEIRRDFEYLLRLWETVRDKTLSSLAPALVHEEGSLIKRSIRDLYGKEVDEIYVSGDDAIEEATSFMKMLMPTHVKHVHAFSESTPLFAHFGVEQQLDAMFTSTVSLKSGGYIVLNQTEALVSIDVNSGKATKEHHIEDTALKTNLEAAEEIARQLRLRDLAGLIVVDFIDMEEFRNNRTVEKKLKDALKSDRARIQVGRISHFGLLEMSRQRLRSSVLENSTERCLHCAGSGFVRSKASLALHILRALEEHLHKNPMHNVVITTRQEVALYILNAKRSNLSEIEGRYKVSISIEAGEVDGGHVFSFARGELVHTADTVYKAPLRNKDEERQKPRHQPRHEKREVVINEGEEPEEFITYNPDGASEEAPAVEGDAKEVRGSRRRRKRNRGDKTPNSPQEAVNGEEVSEEVTSDEAPSVETVEGEAEEPRARGLRRGKYGRLEKRRPKGERRPSEAVIHPEGEVVAAEAPAYVAPAPVAAPAPVYVAPPAVELEAPAPRMRRLPDPEPVATEEITSDAAPKKRGWWNKG